MPLSIKKIVLALSDVFVVTALTACSPEVGSKDWCEYLKAKPKGDWSRNEAADFAKAAFF